MGHIVTSEGIKIDEEKVRAITEMPPPQNIKELRSFLGMINYLSKFIKNCSDEAKDFRQLERKGAHWKLEEHH